MPGKSSELANKFWRSLKSDMIMMLGLVGVEESHTRPMTAQMRGSEGPIWFFTSRENTLVQNLRADSRAIGTFTARDFDLFASIHGRLSLDTDPDVIDELWNSHVEAWYEQGKDDTDLALLRFDPDRAEIWENEGGLFAGLKMLFGRDPRRDAEKHGAQVNLR